MRSRPGEAHSVRRFWSVAVVLALLVAAIYGQTLGHEFINVDDDTYVTNNDAVRDGYTLHGVARAFGFMANNWHPLTWLSHMLDAQAFGMQAWGHHATSVVLHAVNAVLLFALLGSMTGAFWRSALVAALFAVHPLNVESVAWIAERKNVLSTLFLWLSLGAWLRWVRRPSAARYALVLAFYALGLMAKPMLVTLPFLLLLLDWWPLGRFVVGGEAPSWSVPARRLLREKLPLMALAALDGILTMYAQAAGIEGQILATRVANAFVAYAAYLVKMAWPTGLAVLYPYPAGGIPPSLVAGSVVFLAALSALVIAQRKGRPYLAAGWLWYLVILVPVIGLVPVGYQTRADRYTYIPLVGIFIALAWAAEKIASRTRFWRQSIPVAAAAAVAALACTAYLQTARWRDSVSLMGYSARVTAGNYIILNNLGIALMDKNRLPEAKDALEEALRIKPDHANALYNLGNIFFRWGRWREAAELYQRALRYEPDRPDTYINLGICQMRLGRFTEAIDSLEAANVDPAYRMVGSMVNTARSMQRNKEAAERLAPPK